jgi:hypothetical protein
MTNKIKMATNRRIAVQNLLAHLNEWLPPDPTRLESANAITISHPISGNLRAIRIDKLTGAVRTPLGSYPCFDGVIELYAYFFRDDYNENSRLKEVVIDEINLRFGDMKLQ